MALASIIRAAAQKIQPCVEGIQKGEKPSYQRSHGFGSIGLPRQLTLEIEKLAVPGTWVVVRAIVWFYLDFVDEADDSAIEEILFPAGPPRGLGHLPPIKLSDILFGQQIPTYTIPDQVESGLRDASRETGVSARELATWAVRAYLTESDLQGELL